MIRSLRSLLLILAHSAAVAATSTVTVLMTDESRGTSHTRVNGTLPIDSFSDTPGISYGHTRDTFNALALLLLPFLCFIGLVGNAFVCVAIATDRRLQNVTNYFLLSLSIADLLVCCIVMPLSIIVEVKQGVWSWSFHLCLTYVYADVFLCSASIVHMSVISLDRYLGISQPLKMRNKSRTAIFIKITAVWLITILISSPLAVAAIRDPTNVLQNNQCMVHNRYYMIYGSTLAFLIPFFIMAITYVRTTSLLNKQATILSQNGGNRTGGLRRSAPPRKLGQSIRRSSGNASSNNNNNNSSTCSTAKHSTASAHPPGHAWYQSTCTTTTTLATCTKNSKTCGDEMPRMPPTVQRLRSRTSSYLNFFVQRVNKRNFLLSNQELLSEHKATRVLAVVFVCFFICWTPFFAANFLAGFCGDICMIPAWMGSLFLWLGYISSTINPLIYTIFNKRFRKAFIRILRCQCCSPRTDFTSGYWSRTHTIMPDTYTYSNYDRGISRDDATRPSLPGIGEGSTPSPYTTARSVAFAHKTTSNDWSPTSCHTIMSIVRKESGVSRTASVRHTKYKPSLIRNNTEEEEDYESEHEIIPHKVSNGYSKVNGRNGSLCNGDQNGKALMPERKHSTPVNSTSLPHPIIMMKRSSSATRDSSSPVHSLTPPGRKVKNTKITVVKNGHVARAIASECNYRKRLISMNSCTDSIDEEDDNKEQMDEKRITTPVDSVPCITLVAAVTNGESYKETFL